MSRTAAMGVWGAQLPTFLKKLFGIILNATWYECFKTGKVAAASDPGLERLKMPLLCGFMEELVAGLTYWHHCRYAPRPEQGSPQWQAV
jgi:hypothetical protein